MRAELENIDSIEEEIQNKKALNYDELFFQSIAEFPLRKKIADYLKKKGVAKSARIIDIGCGTGELLLYLQNEGYTNLYGNDISENMIKISREKVKKANFFYGSINKVQIDGKFDYIIITEALHHIPDLKMTFESLRSLLKPRGEIVLLEPNEIWYFENFSLKKIADYLVYLPIAPFHKFAGRKNRDIINKNRQYDTPDTFNPFHRHLTVEEVEASTDMKVVYKKYHTFYMGLFESLLFKGKTADKIIYKVISFFDSIIPFGKRGKYFFLVFKN